MNRRERLLASIIGPEMDPEKAKILDTTIKFILGDMCVQYLKFWEAEGPGVMVFQPQDKERSMFFLTLEEGSYYLKQHHVFLEMEAYFFLKY